MIDALRIEHLAVVDAVELELAPGLNVLTGETGAGKSIVLSALALLAGGRASSEVIRQGFDAAHVEAEFRAKAFAPALVAHDLEPEDDVLVASRRVAHNGRHRARLAGESVSVATLAEVLGNRIEIASQHESQALRRSESHGRLLDQFAGLEKPRAAVADAYAALRSADAEIARLRAEREERARRQDFLAFQVSEIDEAKLVPGEFEELSQERSRLAHAEQLRQEAAAAGAALSGDPSLGDALGAGDLVAQAARRLEQQSQVDADLGGLAARLSGAQAEIDEVSSELERYCDSLDVDPARLDEIEDRLTRLENLRRKYGADENEILVYRDRAAAELRECTDAEASLSGHEAARADYAKRLETTAAKLSAGRKRAGAKLGREVEAKLASLAMTGARFEVALPAAPASDDACCGPSGAEVPEFRFVAHAGEPTRPLAKVASGGELSRVYLALRNVLRRAERDMVLVFDEVDAGVGGNVADRVGQALAELAQEHQVLCITHLPQIAARADRHFCVEKHTKSGRPDVQVRVLGESERVEELARMAAGSEVGEATRRHARALRRSARVDS